MTNVFIFGASTTWGAWDKKIGGWVNRLRLFWESKSDFVLVYNLGISGDTTKDLLDRFVRDIRARQESDMKNIIIFSIGDNDAGLIDVRGKQLIPPKQFYKNLLKLIQLAKKFTRMIVFLGSKNVDETKTTPVPWDKNAYYRNSDLMRYDVVIQKVCKETHVLYISMWHVLQKGDWEDGIHPNERGHKKMFERVKKILLRKKIIKT